MVVVLSEASVVNRESLDWQELYSVTETARMLGCTVYPIPHDFEVCETAENALAYMPEFDPPVAGVWVGFIPTEQRYSEIYHAAHAKGVQLLNTPEQHQTIMEFDRYYPLIEGLTPKSIVLTSLEECSRVENEIGFPVFVRGAVKSNKVQGWEACVANTLDELIPIAEGVLQREYRSRGKIVVRELVALRQTGEPSWGFPVTREYRAFVHCGEILAYSFYWDEYTDPQPLTPDEHMAVKRLVREASDRLNIPFIIVDVGQVETGEWIIIECGDAQCAGLSQIPVLELWSKIKDITLDES
jgi:hypothetical protein